MPATETFWSVRRYTHWRHSASASRQPNARECAHLPYSKNNLSTYHLCLFYRIGLFQTRLCRIRLNLVTCCPVSSYLPISVPTTQQRRPLEYNGTQINTCTRCPGPGDPGLQVHERRTGTSQVLQALWWSGFCLRSCTRLWSHIRSANEVSQNGGSR